MKKYIDAEAFMDALYSIDPENDGSDGCTIIAQNVDYTSADLEAMVDGFPAVDVMEIVHARWEYVAENSTGKIMICTACKQPYNPNKDDVRLKRAVENPNFCLFCGAKMDGIHE